MSAYRTRERGATALIIVMFSVLLFVTITIGFMKLMADEQRRTNDNELSQGAYDSALAGVEDGKRVLAACDEGNTAACDAINANVCTTVGDAGFAAPQANGEIYLKTTAGANGTDFEQAYTCIKISRSTPGYTSKLAAEASAVIPLRVAAGEQFDEIEISWFTPGAGGVSSVPLLDSSLSAELPQLAAWSSSAGQKPPIIRAQLIQAKTGGFATSDFDSSGGGNTLYLYPKLGIGTATTNFAIDGRRTGTLEPSLVRCNTDYTLFGGYACRVTIALPSPVGGTAAERVAYLRVTSLYNATQFQVIPKKSTGETVNLFNVQPSIDSTGRAADVFRRVEARVEKSDPNENLLYPRATVDITGNFCKTMTVSSSAADYNAGPCTP